MKNTSLKLAIVSLLLSSLLGCSSDDHTYAAIETEYGTMVVQLYNTTPKHRDNFIKLAEEGFYDDLLFHRVITGFMIQGGDPDSKGADSNKPLGFGGPGYEIDAEIGEIHMKGALAAAHNGNPEKRSSGSQFYIVQGRSWDDNFLDKMEADKGIQYTPAQRIVYKEMGGTPSLDGDYTVFGMVVEGMEVIDQIAQVNTGRANRPVNDVKMKVRILQSYSR